MTVDWFIDGHGTLIVRGVDGDTLFKVNDCGTMPVEEIEEIIRDTMTTLMYEQSFTA